MNDLDQAGPEDGYNSGFETMPLRPLPRRLYKYRSFGTHSLRLLTQTELYYSDPRRFNDPLDCNPTIEIDVYRSSLEKLCYRFLRDAGRNEDDAKHTINNLRRWSTQFGFETEDEFDEYLKGILGDEIKRAFDAEMARKGVCSFSETWASPLMWSHYADEHRGVCIEYDTTKTAHPDIAPVNYRSPRSVKTSDLINWKFKASSEAQRRVSNTYFFAKSPQWKYENEWRDIRDSSGIHTTNLFISGIHFGLRCDSAVVTSIVKLFSGDKTINFFEIYPLNDSFKLKRRPVDRDEVEALGVRRESATLIFKDVVLPKHP
jgi:hypothetical protein